MRIDVITRLVRTPGIMALAYAGLATAPALGQEPDRYFYGPHMWGGGWFFGPLMMIATLALVVVLTVMLVRWIGDQGGAGRTAPNKTAQDILAERFARGEIDKEEFEERRKLLGG